MPFTVSHAAAAVVLRPLRLPLAPLVIGTMSPDLPYFVGMRRAGALTHSAPGLVGIDVPVTLALTALWWFLARPAIHDLAPTPIRRRWGTQPTPRGLRTWAMAALAAGIGAITHVVWDAFTHEDSWGTRSIGWLSADQGPLPGYKWAQYGSGALGLAVIAAALLAWWMRAGRRTGVAAESALGASRPLLRRPRRRAGLIALPFALAVLIGTLTLCFPTETPFSPAHGFTVITATMGAFAGGVLLTTLAWHGLTASRGRPR